MIRRATKLAAAYSCSCPTAVVVIAFPGSKGPSSLLAQAQHLQTQLGLAMEISNLTGDGLPQVPVSILQAGAHADHEPVGCPSLRSLK